MICTIEISQAKIVSTIQFSVHTISVRIKETAIFTCPICKWSIFTIPCITYLLFIHVMSLVLLNEKGYFLVSPCVDPVLTHTISRTTNSLDTIPTVLY